MRWGFGTRLQWLYCLLLGEGGVRDGNLVAAWNSIGSRKNQVHNHPSLQSGKGTYGNLCTHALGCISTRTSRPRGNRGSRWRTYKLLKAFENTYSYRNSLNRMNNLYMLVSPPTPHLGNCATPPSVTYFVVSATVFDLYRIQSSHRCICEYVFYSHGFPG